MTIGAFALLVLTPYAAIASASSDEDAVKAVLSDYKQALERLDGAAPAKLFAPDAEVFESGSAKAAIRNTLPTILVRNWLSSLRSGSTITPPLFASKAMSPSLPSRRRCRHRFRVIHLQDRAQTRRAHRACWRRDECSETNNGGLAVSANTLVFAKTSRTNHSRNQMTARELSMTQNVSTSAPRDAMPRDEQVGAD